MPKPPAEPVEYGHHYLKVPRLGTVIFSPRALRNLYRDLVEDEHIEDVLRLGHDVPVRDNPEISGYRQYSDIRLLFKTRPHLKGAAVVCIDGYRVKP